MSIESGTFNCKVFKLTSELPTDALEKFTLAKLIPNNMILTDKAVSGYVSGFTLDAEINGYNSVVDDYIYLSLRTAKRTMPASLLNTLLLKAMEQYKKENSSDFVPKKIQKEMKDGIIEANIAKMPISYTDVPFVINHKNNCLYVFNTSEAKLDNLKAEFIKLFGIELDDIPSFSTVKNIPRLQLCNIDTGNDFNYADYLTWLMYKNDTSSNSYKIGTEYVVMGEGDIELTNYIDEDDNSRGNIKTILKKGDTVHSSELKSALLAGKKVSAMTLNITRDFGGGVTILRFNANSCDFHISGVQLPDGEEMETAGKFAERMEMLDELFVIFTASIADYTIELKDKTRLQNDVTEWINELPVHIICAQKSFIEIDKMETPTLIKEN